MQRSVVLTAVGADARPHACYNRVKGAMEEALKAPLPRPLASRSIEAIIVARAMVALAHAAPQAVKVAPSGELQQFGRG